MIIKAYIQTAHVAFLRSLRSLRKATFDRLYVRYVGIDCCSLALATGDLISLYRCIVVVVSLYRFASLYRCTLYRCIVASLYRCIVVSLYRCIVVSLYRTVVSLYRCIVVSLYPFYRCIVVSLYRFVSLYRCIVVSYRCKKSPKNSIFSDKALI